MFPTAFLKKHQSFSERVFQRFLNLLPVSKKPQSFSERLFERLLDLLPSSKNPVLEEPKGLLWSSWARVANMLPTSYRKSPNEVTATPNERNWKQLRNVGCISGIFLLLLALISKILEPTFKIGDWVQLRKIGEGVFGSVEKAKNIFSGEEIQDWVLLKKIGEGGFGRVYRAKNIISGEEAALKFVTKKEYQRELQKEARIMGRLHHPNILKMLYPAEMKGNAVLCVEFVDGCSLFDILLKYERLSEIQAWHVMVQLFSAVEYMHGQNIIHLDIKPENVLYSRHHEVKLIDFGLATTFTPGRKVSAFCGTLAYMAPEVVCEFEEYEGPNADIWSLGITLKHLLKGLEEVPENMNICSDDCESLLKGMICIDPARRLTIKEIMRHAWVKQPPCTTLESQSLEAPSWQLSLPLESRSQRS